MQFKYSVTCIVVCEQALYLTRINSKKLCPRYTKSKLYQGRAVGGSASL